MQSFPTLPRRTGHGRAALRLVCALALCLFALLAPALLTPADHALGGSWQWQALGNGEALTFTAATPEEAAALKAAQVSRLERQTLGLHGLNATAFSPVNQPPAGALLHGLHPAAGGLQVTTSTPAFGYLTLRPNAHTLVIRLYYDPLGARWQPSGGLAPASAARQPAPHPAARPTRQASPVTPSQTPQVTQAPGTTPIPTAPASPVSPDAQAAPVQAVQPQHIPAAPAAARSVTPGVTVEHVTPPAPDQLPAQSPAQSPPRLPARPQQAANPTVQADPDVQAGPPAAPRASSVQPDPDMQPAQAAPPPSRQAQPVRQPVQQATQQGAPWGAQRGTQQAAPQRSGSKPSLPPLPTEVSRETPLDRLRPQDLTPAPAPLFPAQENLPERGANDSLDEQPPLTAPQSTRVQPPRPPWLHIGTRTAQAAESAPAQAAQPASPQEVRSRINAGGPEAWPEDQGLSTSLPGASPAPMPGATAPAQATPGPVAGGVVGGGTVTDGSVAGGAATGGTAGGPVGYTTGRMPINQGGPETTPQAPAQAPAQAPQPGQVAGGICGPAAPVQAPAQAPAQAPQPGPVAGGIGGPAVPVQTPAQAPAQAPQPGQVAGGIGGPAAPVQTPAQAPAQAPQPGQVAGGIGGPAAPVQTPAQAPAQAPQPGQVAQQPPAQASPAQPQQPQGQAQGDVHGPVRGEIPRSPTPPEGKGEKGHDGEQAPDDPNARPVIYVDETGKEVQKPLEPEKMLAEAETLLKESKLDELMPLLEQLKGMDLPPPQHEKVLYLISDATAAKYVEKPEEGLDAIVSTTSEAMNANLRSPRVPEALFRLGMAYLRVGNLLDAGGYFKALKRRFPSDIHVPEAMARLGLAQLDKKLYAEAETTLNGVMQEFPESTVLRDCALGLVKALYGGRKYQQAAVIADFIDKRWPRQYIATPDYLRLTAELALALGKQEEALQQFWLYYNLDPKRPENDHILATIGDIYYRTNRPAPAAEIFEEIRDRYKDSPEAAKAWQRLAEKGIYDDNITLEGMERIFANAGTPSPPVAYAAIRKGWPDSARATLCELKMVVWKLYNQQYTDAMGAGADFIDAHPEHPGVPLARDVIVRAFREDLKNALAEENYGRILLLWNGFPLVRKAYGPLDDVMRHALARGYLERGDEKKAMELFAPFLRTPKHPLYSEPTFALYFNKYLQESNWNGLLDLGELVKNWDMQPELRRQIDYAMALAAENLGLTARALGMWRKLAADPEVPLYQRAYAYYFLARDAEQRKDIRDAYSFNKTTMELFSKLEQERSDKSDPARIKQAINSLMDITEVANRIPEALDWVERYNRFVPENSPEYPGLRFREARLYRKLGNTAKARALLRQIVDTAPDTPFGKAAAMELRTFDVSRDLQDYMDTPAPQNPTPQTPPAQSQGQPPAQSQAQPPAQQ